MEVDNSDSAGTSGTSTPMATDASGPNKRLDFLLKQTELFSHFMGETKAKSPLKDGEARPTDLETLFFDHEVCMEGEVCRDTVSLDPLAELHYLQDISETLLYLLLPEKEFCSAPVRCLVREMLVSLVFQPSLNHFCDLGHGEPDPHLALQ